MEFFKKQYQILTVVAFILLGCSSDDEQNTTLEIKVTNFETSYSQVKLNWELVRPNGIIIDDLLIYRQSKNNATDSDPLELVANLPSNETTFTDTDVPYKTEVTYTIKINYTDQRITPTNPIVPLSLESEQKKFIRDIVTFDIVPFQVKKDPILIDEFHILDRQGNGALKRYNGSQNQLTKTRQFTNGSLLNNKFHIINNTDLYIADTQGKISKINTENYTTSAIYNTVIIDNLNAFAVDGDRIYYQDEEIWWYYNTFNGTSENTGIASSANYVETLSDNNFLFLYGGGADIRNYNPSNCNTSNCFPDFGAGTQGAILPNNTFDPNIFSWNTSKSKFITSIDGRIFNLSNFQEEIKLNDITGKKYFQFVFDNDNNIYATVQNEKKIHKFNTNYEFIEIIDTKLYPLFPMLTSNGLKVIGSYEPVTYWSFGYGNSFNFNVKCAIETF
ncbi:hypothetical protein B0I03_107172 [Flavobacterium aquaticum]|uniref:Uncharacterized protein n=1 Tax=Flavobacterium aquaticum TaxID=1236486 RepID=A0A327YJR4_9FLAO|nr:hypothetical protein [Flavobacterium aquaticum]RAK20751.1 hypothetical protein B0I03_107172 [Flavobacterium aquaticum]